MEELFVKYIPLILCAAGAAAAVAAIAAVFAAAKYGAFEPVPIVETKAGGETAVLEAVSGPYTQCGAAMDRVYYALRDEWGIETTLGIGIYYSDPKKVKKEDLRSEAGCIVREQDIAGKDGISARFLVRKLEETHCLQAEFPYRGKLSVLFGVMKVYPALARFASERGFDADSPVSELYDIPNGKIVYRKTAVMK